MAIDTTLEKIRRQSEEMAASELAKTTGLNYANLDDYPFNLEVLSLIPIKTVEEQMVAAYVRSADRIRVAVVHPQDPLTQQLINQLSNEWHVAIEPLVVSNSSMHHLLLAYARLLKEDEERRRLAANEDKKKHHYTDNIRDLSDLQQNLTTISITDLLDILLSSAVTQEASDVHLEPGEQLITVRFRIDGVLQRVLEIPMALHHNLISRIKMQAGIKLDQRSINQDGRFTITDSSGAPIDIRVSSVPTGYGEGVVMRLLRQDREVASLQELGFTPYNLSLIEHAIRRPYGLILVTGPTGSGKSTTLYSLLKILNTPERKIITLEDPIEYKISGVQQSQIKPEDGFTFAEGLKGALRQDPDVIMVGEIRDPDTATIALNASLTGHLVLSTLHTNNAVTAHTRFLEMGIPAFLLAGSIQLVIAQRLVRRVVDKDEQGNPIYKGRVVISEILTPSTDFEQAVIQHQDQTTLESLARKAGMVPMIQDGMEKVKAGITSESEIYRVTSAD